MATQAAVSASRFFHFAPEQVLPARVSLSRVLDLAAARRCVLVGEVHENAAAIGLQEAIQGRLLESVRSQPIPGVLHVVMEHFNWDMQGLLDSFARGQVSFSQLEEHYHEMGIEGHNIAAYKPILSQAHRFPDSVRIHGGFIPRQYAKALFNAEEEKVIAAAAEKGYVPPSVTLEGSEVHYQVFEAMFNDIHAASEDSAATAGISYPESVRGDPSNRYRRIFRAQVLKDEAMAYRTAQVLQEAGRADKVLVVCGAGHIIYGCGVPERLFHHHPEVADDSFSVILGQAGSNDDGGAAAVASKYGRLEGSRTLYGIENPVAADVVMVAGAARQSE